MTIAAIVLAAGLSRRMGQPKMVLPWAKKTVVVQVVSILHAGGIEPIIVVTGGARQEVEFALAGLPVTFVFNPDYANGEMIHSLQAGLRALPTDVEAVLMVLGDQPQIQIEVVTALVQAYHESRAALIVPSFQMRRGHPWVIDRRLWPEILAIQPPASLRDFLSENASLIQHLVVDHPSVLQDIDTPEDYSRQRPS
jgi:molybdenum cofactor cytidylyltransferase